MQDGKQGGITPFQAKGGNHTNLLHVAAINEEQKNWPTANARDWKDSITGTHPPSRPRMSEQTLGQAVSVVHGKDAANWPTPQAQDTQRTPEAYAAAKEKRGGKMFLSLNIAAQLHGQAAPASSSSLGSRQGLWQTPKATNADCPVIHNPQRNDGGQPNLAAQMVLEQQRQWATPQAHDAQGPKTPEQIAVMRAKGHGVKNLNEQAQWGTPTARDHKSGRGNNEREYKELTPMVERQQSSKLNPRWVETLMGLPIGWTMPSCTSPQTIAPMSCGSSAMELCPPPQSELSEFSLAS
jgi:hypothetical protein